MQREIRPRPAPEGIGGDFGKIPGRGGRLAEWSVELVQPERLKRNALPVSERVDQLEPLADSLEGELGVVIHEILKEIGKAFK